MYVTFFFIFIFLYILLHGYCTVVKYLSEQYADIEHARWHKGHETEANQQDMNLQMVKVFCNDYITCHIPSQ